MALTTTAEQEALRDVMRAFLAKHSTEELVRREMDGPLGYDEKVWRALAEQIGIQALAIPEEFGGAGYGFDEIAVVMEESGRSLYSGPLLSTVVLAANALLLSGDREACDRYLPRIADGSLIATVAVSERKSYWSADDVATAARTDSDSWLLTGTKAYVLDGSSADVVIVAASTENGVSLFAVEQGADGLDVRVLDGMDATRRHAALTLTDTPATLIGTDGGGWQVLSGVFDHAIAALACEQVGASAHVLEATVEYLGVREQFGRPIGSFQAIKHRCADMLVELESSRSAAAYAASAVTGSADDASTAASIARVYCSQAAYHIAAESIQMHGGIGFTWEHPAHLYFKRAKTSQIMFGSPSAHRDRIAELIGMTGGN